jgi:uncharacterized protein
MKPDPKSLGPADAALTVPWWNVGMVWFVLSGPALVVVAAIATAAIAISGADTVVSAQPQQLPTTQATALTPAVQARNHAATAPGAGALKAGPP